MDIDFQMSQQIWREQGQYEAKISEFIVFANLFIHFLNENNWKKKLKIKLRRIISCVKYKKNLR